MNRSAGPSRRRWSALRQRSGRLLRAAIRPLRRIWPRTGDALLGLASLVVVGLALLTYAPGVYRAASRLAPANRYLAAVDGMLNPFRTRHALLDAGLPIYDLRIASRHMATLEDVAAEAKRLGWMSDDEKVWVPATFIAENARYDVQVRLRGDLPNHWTGAKKSWRVKFGDEIVTDELLGTREETIPFDGRRQINLIIPNDRDYAIAPFLNDLLRDEGLVVPRDRFVILRINGRMQGVYYEVEQFDKPMLALAERPETAIFGQNDRAMHFDQYTRLGAAGASDARFDLASMRRLVEPTDDLALPAMQVLLDHELNPTPANFRRARAVLDWPRYLRLRALTTLLNTNHVRFGSDNLRLFHDASTGLLEPVPWDAHLVRMPVEPGTIDYWNSHGPDELQRATLLDPALRLERNKILWGWVGDGGRALMARYDRFHDRVRPALWADVLSSPIQAYKMDRLRQDLDYNVKRTHKVLALSSANLVYRLEADDRAAVEVASLNFSGIRLVTLTITDTAVFRGRYRLLEDSNDNGELDAADRPVATTNAAQGTVRFPIDTAILPELRYDGDTIGDTWWEYYDTLAGRRRYFILGRLAPQRRDPLLWTAPEIDVAARNAVTDAPLRCGLVADAAAEPEGTVGILAYDASHPFDLDALALTAAEFLARHPQFTPDPERDGAVQLAGPVVITETVIVPPVVPLAIRPGADITLGPGASILAYGGLRAVGAPTARIRVHGDGSGQAWGTVASVRAPEPVVVRHADFADGGQAQVNGILFTGGFAVYDSDLELVDSRFLDMQSEDAINLKNGRIDMRRCLVARSASDGIDVDFGSGEIRDSQFLDSGGDGIDFSGSTTTVLGNRIEGSGDKCISVGEASHPILVNNLLKDCVIGVAAKDLSVARVAYSTFVDNDVAIEAFRKKWLFGPGAGLFVANVFAGNRVVLAEDYFSHHQVTLSRSLLDGPARCDRCATVSEVRFRAPERGDYRLVGGGIADLGRVAVEADWATALVGSPNVPGVVAVVDPVVIGER